MKAVFRMFWRMCLLRQSPAYLPTQSWFVATVVVANLLTSVIVSISIDQSENILQIATRVVVGQATYAALVWLATYLREVASRFAATLTALFGCDLLITALFGLLVPVAGMFGQGLLTALSLLFLVWSLAVAGFILAQALSIRVGVGVALAIGITVLTVATGQIAIGA